MEPLTDTEAAVLEIIVSAIERNGKQPTLAVIAGHMGWSNPAAARNYLMALERKGRLRRDGRAKCVELVGIRFARVVA